MKYSSKCLVLYRMDLSWKTDVFNDTRGSHYRVVCVCVCAYEKVVNGECAAQFTKHRFIIDTNKLTFHSIGIFVNEDLHVDNF